jgi:hypothetical protein
MAARSLTDEAINALKAVNRAERDYAKAQKAKAGKAEVDPPQGENERSSRDSREGHPRLAVTGRILFP